MGSTDVFQDAIEGWHVEGFSTKGPNRERNEDRYAVHWDLLTPKGARHVFAVFDGVGGQPNGAEAAQAATDALPDAVLRGHVLQDLREAVRPTGGSTTGVVTALAPGRDGLEGHILAVGDSAAFSLVAGGLEALVPEDRDAFGRLTDHLANPSMEGHHVPLRLSATAPLLICTDGVHGVLPHEVIAAAISEPGPAQALLAAVEAAGAPDNATAIIVRRDPDVS